MPPLTKKIIRGLGDIRSLVIVEYDVGEDGAFARKNGGPPDNGAAARAAIDWIDAMLAELVRKQRAPHG